MTKVVHLLNHNSPSGNAAFRLHTALLEGGVDSYMLSLSSDVPISERVDKLRLRANFKVLLNNRLHSRKTRKADPSYGMFSSPILGNNVVSHEMVQNSDIIYLHWICGGFLNYKNIEDLAKLNKPIIFFMHDMWTITGGCHYSFSCENYKTDCSSCQMFPHGGSELPMKEFKKKSKLYSSYKNLYFAAPSTWLTDLAKKSALTRDKPIYHLPNVIDYNMFKSFDKNFARNILNIKDDGYIIAFGAVSPKSPYKGWRYLKEALELLYQEKGTEAISILIFGSDHDAEIANAIPFKTTFLGRLRDEYSTALVYNAADIFMAPSLADNLPTTVMESLCCGTPVVGFDNGGIPDMVVHHQNGYLAKYKDSQDLMNGIKYCLSHKMEVKPPSIFNTDAVINTHKKLYKEMLSS